MNSEIVQQGAEAKIIKQGNLIIKDRISKSYRHPLLDKKIIKQRTKSESKILEKASKLIPVPNSEAISENKIKLDFVEGKKLSESLEQLNWKEICKIIGNQISILHDNNIIHGDLTTSNMILQDAPSQAKDEQKLSKNISINNKIKKEAEQEEASFNKASPRGEPSNFTSLIHTKASGVESNKLFFIDFGLSFISNRIEDKAVDLHLIKQALEAKHFSIWKECWKIIQDNYNSKDKLKILEQLKKVELRGRYKH
jgi:tRNA A-37 threonylcarbamoyl transferase component Bud32